jgi:hypothetical protein
MACDPVDVLQLSEENYRFHFHNNYTPKMDAAVSLEKQIKCYENTWRHIADTAHTRHKLSFCILSPNSESITYKTAMKEYEFAICSNFEQRL